MRLILAVCLFILASPVLAQTGSPTPEEVAAARSQADQLIDAAGAQGIFRNITGDARPTVIHSASGLICIFQSGSPNNQIAVFPTGQSSIPRGDDVGCHSTQNGVDITHYATRYPGGLTAERAAQDAAASIMQRFPAAVPFDGPVMDVSSSDLPRSYFARFTVMNGTQPYYTHAATADVGGWIFKQRLSAPAERSQDAQITGMAQWMGTLAFAQARPFDAPQTD